MPSAQASAQASVDTSAKNWKTFGAMPEPGIDIRFEDISLADAETVAERSLPAIVPDALDAKVSLAGFTMLQMALAR